MSKIEHVSLGRDLVQALGDKETWSDAVSFGGLIWTTGQIGWDKSTAKLVDGLEAQVELALENLVKVLHEAGSSLENVLLTRIYITEHDHYYVFDEIYKRYFVTNPPARVTVVVKELIDHALFDIEVVAVKDDLAAPQDQE